ncbi:MAG: D-tyrosyl-tRNA(Tyr) deacylase [Gammaproteobacteria bacterium]|nr:D-tyrosyl-tRNA(Tyr) deacylase [Gammaproteobacteria bacterium]
MIGLLQRVSHASVTVEGECIAKIGTGLMVLVGVEKSDSCEQAERLVKKLLEYRVFADDDGKMNQSVLDIAGEVLLVPQFTLAADTGKGKRPSFSSAAPSEQGADLFAAVVDIMSQQQPQVQTGRFGADMAVELINDGPVTFWLQV